RHACPVIDHANGPGWWPGVAAHTTYHKNGPPAHSSSRAAPVASFVRKIVSRRSGRCSRNRYSPWRPSHADWRSPSVTANTAHPPHPPPNRPQNGAPAKGPLPPPQRGEARDRPAAGLRPPRHEVGRRRDGGDPVDLTQLLDYQRPDHRPVLPRGKVAAAAGRA